MQKLDRYSHLNGRQFTSFSVHIKHDYCDTDMTLLTVTNYILYLRHWIFNKNNMTGVISDTETAYPFRII